MLINTLCIEPKRDRWATEVEIPGETMRIGMILPTVINSPHIKKTPIVFDSHCRSFAAPGRNDNELHVNDQDMEAALKECDGLLATKGANFEGKIKAERPKAFGMAGKGLDCDPPPPVPTKVYPSPLPLPKAQSVPPPTTTTVVEPKKMSRRVIYLNDNNNCKWVEAPPCCEWMCL